MLTEQKDHALTFLKQMLGTEAYFRPGQWEAIETVAVKKNRALVVQRTGWGKSIVYFLATKLLREHGAGPTLLISPLLSLMRNQITMAERIGIHALTINSSNQSEWEEIEGAIAKGRCDLLLISPERLNNARFIETILPTMTGKIGLFVVDEAHCISDWGHDFRPDYRRIVRILKLLPRGVPVLGTTATANDRVVNDVHSQLGKELLILRGPLARESLRLQNIRLETQSERLAWLAENLPTLIKLDGSGIVYCLTIADVERVTKWLKKNGIKAEAYHAGDDKNIDRPLLEDAFYNNEIQVLVATVALGMGYDKPDVSFVVHFQRPGSVVAYYQQVGRAGRAVDRAYGVLLSGVEDDEIQDYFIKSGFPSVEVMKGVIEVLESVESLSINEILSRVNTRYSMLEKALKLLELDGAIGMTYDKKKLYFRTPNPWEPDIDHINRVTTTRRDELLQMQEYVNHESCLMEFLMRVLDDPEPKSCGRCANCQGKGFQAEVSHQQVIEAEKFLKGDEIILRPRKRWPVGFFSTTIIPDYEMLMSGRALCYYGDAGWGRLVRKGKYQDGRFSDELVLASANLIQDIWEPSPAPEWIAAIPSLRHPELVYDFAERLSKQLNIPFIPVLKRTGDVPEQKTMENSYMQASNVQGTLEISGQVRNGPVLLIDDIVDSGWTLTLAGWMIINNSCKAVHPFVLARATARSSS